MQYVKWDIVESYDKETRIFFSPQYTPFTVPCIYPRVKSQVTGGKEGKEIEFSSKESLGKKRAHFFSAGILPCLEFSFYALSNAHTHILTCSRKCVLPVYSENVLKWKSSFDSPKNLLKSDKSFSPTMLFSFLCGGKTIMYVKWTLRSIDWSTNPTLHRKDYLSIYHGHTENAKPTNK